MKKLLEDVLELLEAEEWQWRGEEDGARCIGCFAPFERAPWDPITKSFGPEPQPHEATCTWKALRDRIRTALAALEPGASPQEVIMAQADRLEDEGDWRAETTRLLFTEPLDVARILTSIKVDAGEGYCSITQTQPGNYVISGITFDRPGEVNVAWTLPNNQGVSGRQQ